MDIQFGLPPDSPPPALPRSSGASPHAPSPPLGLIDLTAVGLGALALFQLCPTSLVVGMAAGGALSAASPLSHRAIMWCEQKGAALVLREKPIYKIGAGVGGLALAFLLPKSGVLNLAFLPLTSALSFGGGIGVGAWLWSHQQDGVAQQNREAAPGSPLINWKMVGCLTACSAMVAISAPHYFAGTALLSALLSARSASFNKAIDGVATRMEEALKDQGPATVSLLFIGCMFASYAFSSAKIWSSEAWTALFGYAAGGGLALYLGNRYARIQQSLHTGGETQVATWLLSALVGQVARQPSPTSI